MTPTREQFRAFLAYNTALDNELDGVYASSSLVTPRDAEAAKGLIAHMERGTVHVLESPASIFKLAEAAGVETRWTPEQEAVIDKTDRAMAEYRRCKSDRVISVEDNEEPGLVYRNAPKPVLVTTPAKLAVEDERQFPAWLGWSMLALMLLAFCALAVMIRRHG